MERRFTTAFEVRAISNEHGPVLEGYASVFNSLSRAMPTPRGGKFYERVSPMAFTRAIQKGKTVANLFHDMTKPLGTQRAGTLQLSQDSHGLHVRCQINPAVSYASDAWHSAKSGELRSMSFAFEMPGDGSGEDWDDFTDEDGERCAKRSLNDVETLHDVAFLTDGMGAYDEANFSARSFFPEGASTLIETRSGGRVVVPDVAPTEEELRLELLKVRLF